MQTSGPVTMLRTPLMPLLMALLLMLMMVKTSSAGVLSAGISSDRPLHRADRVVGGTEVSQDSVKWAASLQYSGTGMHFCGATVIGDFWLVTAAHCMYRMRPDHFRVVTGGTDLDSGDLQVRIPAKVIVADYDDRMKENDLALIRTETPLEPSVRVSGQFLQLAERRPAAGTRCMVLGWGYPRQGGDTVRRLRHAPVTTQTNSMCQREFSDRGYSYYTITETMLCAGDPGRDACQGDSGGPLVCRADGRDLSEVSDASANQLRLAGAVSWGVGCATPTLPGVYADVASMIDWVRDMIDAEESSG